MKLSHHILLGLLASLTLRANAQSNIAAGLEIAAAGSESSAEEDDWGAQSSKTAKKAIPVQAEPTPSSAPELASPSSTAAKPAAAQSAIPAAPAAAVGATATPAAVASPTPANNLPAQQAPQAPKAAVPEAALEPVPALVPAPSSAPMPKPAAIKAPPKPAAVVQPPAAPSNGAAQQTTPVQAQPKQVPAGVPLSPNTAVNPSNAAAVGNPMLPAKDIPSNDSTDDLRGDPNTSSSATRAKAKVKPSDVGLSSDQTSAILEIRKAAQNTVEKRLTEELKVAKQDLNTSMVDATPAEEVRKKFDLVQKKYLDLQKIKFERTLKIREVLSVEQRKKLQGLKTSH